MKKESISIIIPTFNSRAKIISCLDSVIAQTFNDFELIVVDGLSTDHTIDLIRRHLANDSRLKLISEKDTGIYDAMNKGIGLAKGDWLYFLGSDDELFDNNVLQRVADAAAITEQHVIYGNAKIIGNTSWAKDGSVYDGVFDLHKLLKKNICHQSIFYRRAFIREKIGHFNLAYSLCADWDFNLKCMANTEFQYMDHTIAKFFAGGVSTENYLDEKFSQDFLQNILSYFGLTVFDPVVNREDFPYYQDLLKLQKKQNYLKYAGNRLKRKLL
ncbi:MAG TPA: glycosyltransferase family 2 protein [Puia sp.]|nr:glycosyltransferase family 2 protein [Puia sp.]